MNTAQHASTVTIWNLIDLCGVHPQIACSLINLLGREHCKCYQRIVEDYRIHRDFYWYQEGLQQAAINAHWGPFFGHAMDTMHSFVLLVMLISRPSQVELEIDSKNRPFTS